MVEKLKKERQALLAPALPMQSASKSANKSKASPANQKPVRTSSASAARKGSIANAAAAPAAIAPYAAPQKKRTETTTPSKALTPNRYGAVKAKTPKRLGSANPNQPHAFMPRSKNSIEYGLLNPVLLRSKDPRASQGSEASTPASKRDIDGVDTSLSKEQPSPERGAKTRAKIEDQKAVIARLKL